MVWLIKSKINITYCFSARETFLFDDWVFVYLACFIYFNSMDWMEFSCPTFESQFINILWISGSQTQYIFIGTFIFQKILRKKTKKPNQTLGWESDLDHVIIFSHNTCGNTWAACAVQWQKSVVVPVLMKVVTSSAYLEGCKNHK